MGYLGLNASFLFYGQPLLEYCIFYIEIMHVDAPGYLLYCVLVWSLKIHYLIFYLTRKWPYSKIDRSVWLTLLMRISVVFKSVIGKTPMLGVWYFSEIFVELIEWHNMNCRKYKSRVCCVNIVIIWLRFCVR